MPKLPILSVLLLAASALAQPCLTGAWQRTFGEGVTHAPSSIGAIQAYADVDPPGPEPARLVVAGLLDHAGGIPTTGVASWDGLRWRSMDAGLSGVVLALHRTHQTNVLYAGGSSVGGAFVARWTGEQWVPLPPLSSTVIVEGVDYIHAFDPDGAGPLPERLVAGVSVYGGLYRVTRLFEWDGFAWQQLPGQWGGVTSDMTVFTPPGGQPALYIAIWSFGLGNSSTYSLVRWDGVQTTTIATEYCSQSCGVQLRAIEVVNDLPGGQSSLYAAGRFTTFAGVPARSVARWDGQTWQAADMGLGTGPAVADLTVFDIDGAGPGGPQLVASAVAVGMPRSLVRWNGATWSTPFVTFDTGAYRIIPFNDGVASLFAMGEFSVTGNNFTSGISRSIGSLWAPVGQSLNNSVYAMTTVPESSTTIAPGLYAGGAFYTAGSSLAVGIARWNGSAWSPLPGLGNQVRTLAHGLLYAGDTLVAGGLFPYGVAHWTAAGWIPLGDPIFNDNVNSLVFDGLLYAGSGTPPYIHWFHFHYWRWDPVGTGTDGPVHAILGDTTQLIVGGEFAVAGFALASNIARLSGMTWHPMGPGLNGRVRTLALHDDGSGPAVFAAGDFTMSGPTPVNRIARWNGTQWSALDGGVNGPVHSLASADIDGPGPLPARLIVGGEFTHAGGISANHIAQWDGSAWHALDTGADNTVRALAAIDADAGGPQPPSLFLGGDFRNAGGASSPYIAQWTPCPCYANCDNSTVAPILNANDFQCFLSRFANNDPYANCDGSTVQPVLNANDFACFLNTFIAGCP